MSEIKVRLAEFDDWETISRYNCLLAVETEETQLDQQKIDAGVQAILQDENKGRYFVAVNETGDIVGQLMHTLEWSDWRNGQIWWLQSVYVHADYRRQGVFRQLFDRLANEANQNPGVVGLRLYVEHQNEIAQQTYQKLGFGLGGYHVMQNIF
jgi:ribosomal protein S18 acetylase RimI-like enzyme